MVKRREFLKDGLLLAAGTACSSDLMAASGSVGSSRQSTVSLKREIPVRYDADVVIIGGGISGVSAACSAAFSGASVILVERFGMLGGTLTTGGVANFCGQIDAQGEVLK
jgi:NADPH-dependent 2,4-dienoyl-CoA reductase/sulfur reductase-like enzyme